MYHLSLKLADQQLTKAYLLRTAQCVLMHNEEDRVCWQPEHKCMTRQNEKFSIQKDRNRIH